MRKTLFRGLIFSINLNKIRPLPTRKIRSLVEKNRSLNKITAYMN